MLRAQRNITAIKMHDIIERLLNSKHVCEFTVLQHCVIIFNPSGCYWNKDVFTRLSLFFACVSPKKFDWDHIQHSCIHARDIFRALLQHVGFICFILLPTVSPKTKTKCFSIIPSLSWRCMVWLTPPQALYFLFPPLFSPSLTVPAE